MRVKRIQVKSLTKVSKNTCIRPVSGEIYIKITTKDYTGISIRCYNTFNDRQFLYELNNPCLRQGKA